jgi:hypothetical protein
MRLEGFGERKHTIIDVLVLLMVVGLALVTWSSAAGETAVPPWRLQVSVAVTLLFALAALTRHPGWAAAIRLLIGGWLICAPTIFGFAGVEPALWSHLVSGAVLIVLSAPGLTVLQTRRTEAAPWQTGGKWYQGNGLPPRPVPY